MWTSPLLRLVWSSMFHLQPSRDLQKSSLKPGHNSNNNMDLELRKLRRSILLGRRSKRSAWDQQCADNAFKPNGWVRLRKDDIKKSASSLRRVLRKREMLRSMENTGQQFFNSRVRALHQEMRKLIILSNAVFLDMKFCPPMKKSLGSSTSIIRVQRMLKKRADGGFLSSSARTLHHAMRSLINLTHAIHQRLWLFRYLQQAVQFLFSRSGKSATKPNSQSKSRPPIMFPRHKFKLI